jgi:hypothetical protein
MLAGWPLPSLGPGTYCVSATHLQGIYLPMWGPWRTSWEERFQDRRQAMDLLTPLSPEDRQNSYGVGPEMFERIGADFHMLEYHRLIAQLREREPDAVLEGAILVYRLDPSTFQSLLQAGPPAQTTLFVE